jgi:hypothetical protein
MKALLINERGVFKQAWNTDAHVGLRSPNKMEDVHLVQFGFFCMGLVTSKIPDPQNRAIYAAIKLQTSCTGQETDPLVIAIRTMEKSRGGTQDGFVSNIPGSTGVYADAGGGKHANILLALLNNMFDAVGGTDWPRLDKHPRCPPLVKARIVEACTL